VWESDRDAFIKRGCQQRGFAVARMSYRSDSMRIHVRVVDQVIDTTVKTPGPRGDGAAVGGVVPG
jgi:hypothetical protein